MEKREERREKREKRREKIKMIIDMPFLIILFHVYALSCAPINTLIPF